MKKSICHEYPKTGKILKGQTFPVSFPFCTSASIFVKNYIRHVKFHFEQ